MLSNDLYTKNFIPKKHSLVENVLGRILYFFSKSNWSVKPEKILARKVIDLFERKNWWHTKLEGTSTTGLPDYIFIKNSRVLFVEFKAEKYLEQPNRGMSVMQKYIFPQMMSHGAELYIVYSIGDAMKIFNSLES